MIVNDLLDHGRRQTLLVSSGQTELFKHFVDIKVRTRLFCITTT